MLNNLTDLSPYDWLPQKLKDSTSFLYSKCVIDLQVLIVFHVRSIREWNFKLHLEVLFKLFIWFFIFDHFHYAHWLTIQWFDMYTIEPKFPDLYNYFSNGNFPSQKTNWEFLRMGLDQIHEQNKKFIKEAGGASDLLNKEDDSTLLQCRACTCNTRVWRLLGLEWHSCWVK